MAVANEPVLSLENEVFSKYVFYTTLLLFKMLCVALWTSTNRVNKKVFSTPEDYRSVGKEPVLTEDPDIERIRKCHRNDLENIPVFALLSFMYVLTQPDPWTATLIFRIFTCSRILHTFFFLNAVRFPTRFLAFTCGMIVNMYLVFYLLTVSSY